LALIGICIGLFFIIRWIYSTFFKKSCNDENFLGMNRTIQEYSQSFKANTIADNLRDHYKNTKLPYGMTCTKVCRSYANEGYGNKK